MERSKAEALIKSIATFNVVDPDLAIAIAEAESHFDELAARHETGWKYLYNVESFAKNSRISQDTERIFQMTSWGMMQVMGSVARELGHRVNLLELTKPEVGVRFGCLKLKDLMRKYSKPEDVIASYNAGSPRKVIDTGKYFNQTYVDKVHGLYVQRKAFKRPGS